MLIVELGGRSLGGALLGDGDELGTFDVVIAVGTAGKIEIRIKAEDLKLDAGDRPQVATQDGLVDPRISSQSCQCLLGAGKDATGAANSARALQERTEPQDARGAP